MDNIAKELTQYADYKFEELNQVLTDDGFDIAYGTTYSLKEIHKAITDQQPAFIQLKKSNGIETVYVVGANNNSLVIYKNDDFYEIADTVLLKAWTGNAVIALDKISASKRILKSTVYSEDSQNNASNLDYVIFAPERDTWSEEYLSQKEKGKSLICKINTLAMHMLPAHPVIVLFKKPSDEMLKKGVRAANNGVEIQLYDISDPYTEFLHELGHVYWKTRLIEDEKETWARLHSILPKVKPSIFLAGWDSATGEEMFCTVYYWYLRGMTTHSGYIKILYQQYQQGCSVLEDIFNRVNTDTVQTEVQKARERSVLQEWYDKEKTLSKWLLKLQKKPLRLAVKNKGRTNLLKGALDYEIEMSPLEFPGSIAHTVIHTVPDRQWIRIEGPGILTDQVVVLKGDRLDIEYMSHNKNYSKIPLQKNEVINGRQLKRKTYIDPDVFLKAQQKQNAEVLVSSLKAKIVLPLAGLLTKFNFLKKKKNA